MTTLWRGSERACTVHQGFLCEKMLIYSKLLCNLVNSLTNGVQLCGLAVHLVCSRVQEQLSVSYTSELGVSLLSWVTEVLNFSHCELPTNKNMFKTNMFQNMTSIIDSAGEFHCPLQDCKIMPDITFPNMCHHTYLTLMSPDRGEISFRKAFPICAAANGKRPWLNSSRRLKFTNIPCAVSGRKKL
jgi:hypothetical protein